jgi:hypothetical protein
MHNANVGAFLNVLVFLQPVSAPASSVPWTALVSTEPLHPAGYPEGRPGRRQALPSLGF